jgi:hypothetical protein
MEKGAARSRSRERSEGDLGRACLSRQAAGHGRLSDLYPKVGGCGEAADILLSDRDRTGAFYPNYLPIHTVSS